MKRISFVLALIFAFSVNVFAQEIEVTTSSLTAISQRSEFVSPILKDVQNLNEDGQRRIIKTWEVPTGYDTENLVEEPFSQNNYTYRKSYILLVSENMQTQSKLASNTVTVSHTEKDGAIILLSPLMDYDSDGFKGQLKLDTNSIFTEGTSKQNYSYTVSDTREYAALERNDTYNIPKTVTKSGLSLSLQNVDWRAMGNGSYTATAHYSAIASGTTVSGYTSTATYIGEVVKTAHDSTTYAVVYEGSLIPLPAPDYLKYLLIAALVLILIGTAVFLWNKRKNARIYAFIDGEYKVVHKVRVSYIDPIIDLTSPNIQGIAGDYLVVIDRFAAKRLNNQSIRVLCADGTVKEHRLANNGYGCKLKVGTLSKEENI